MRATKKITINRDRYNDLLKSEEILKVFASYRFHGEVEVITGKPKKESLTLSKQATELKPGWQDRTIKLFERAILPILTRHARGINASHAAGYARAKGTQATQKKKERRYEVASKIFRKLQAKGERLPIKQSAIAKVVHPFWPKTKLNPPKEKTLFAFQRRFLSEHKVKA